MLRSAHLCILLTSLVLVIILSFLTLEQSSTQIISEQFLQLKQSQSAPNLLAIMLTCILSLNVILPVPASLASVYAVSSLDNLLAPAVIWLGLTLSSLIGYWLGAKLNQVLSLNTSSSPVAYKTEKNTNRVTAVILVLFRAIPVLAETSIIAAGLIRFPIRQFILLVSLTNAGLAFAYTYLGNLASKSEAILFLIIAGIVLPTSVVLAQKIFQILLHFYRSNNHNINNKEQQKQPSTRLAPPLNNTLQSHSSIHEQCPIIFTQDLWAMKDTHKSPLLMLLNNQKKQQETLTICCIIDENVSKQQSNLRLRIQHFFNACQHVNLISPPIIISEKEQEKQSTIIKKLYPLFSQNALNKHSQIIAIGGGSLFDAVSFTVNTCYQGLPFIRVPSTVLSASDTSIKDQSNINIFSNGSPLSNVSRPLAVFNDFSLLNRSTTQDKHAGLVLIIKIAILKDAQFFNWLEVNANALFHCCPKENQYAIQRCAQLALQHTTSTAHFHEQEIISPLEYGHWSAYKLKKLSQDPLNDAQALAIGICLDAYYSTRIGLLHQDYSIRIVKLFNRVGFSLWHNALFDNTRGELTLLKGLDEFRLKFGPTLHIPLLTSIGYSKTIHNIDHDVMKEAVEDLFRWHQQTDHLLPKQRVVA
ncbi:3-dehydroquinate synthase family protein [Shewanella surugensis]|uniref:VTT domain-containing protein n=1 Tax=Shewanella surugensis TaxID=212020 RepID=A0ABT0LGD6_9GAMM|nr:VTT domain-containing protein [Shewanella surugensis]MCL1126417.1 VTT domain-containing protein [Shewanella surugensis]